MDWLFLAGFAVASSIDNLAVAVSYGIRGVRIPLRFNLLIAAICFAFSEVGVLVGDVAAQLLPGALPSIAGALLLFALGARIVLLALSAQPAPEPGRAAAGMWGATLRSMRGLLAADIGRIGWPEAVLLGVALSANALTNALGAGLIGFSAFAMASTAALGSFVTMAFGVAIGRRSASARLGPFDVGRHGALVSGIILLTLAAAKVM